MENEKLNTAFPKDFIWGTATSAHQTEGNNTNSDWWAWEQATVGKAEFPKELSGSACDSYNRYTEDFDLCKALNTNAVRISIEWARIEPTEGTIDYTELDHYRQVLKAAKGRGLKTFVTLHHFTNPLWLAKQGGWHNPTTPKKFAAYAKVCAQHLGGLIDVFLTINEPQVYTLMSYIKGVWPPNKKNFLLALVVQLNLIRGHRLAYTSIKKVAPQLPVGIVKNIVWYEPAPEPYNLKFLDTIAAKLLYFTNCDLFLWPIKNHLDLIGLNYYFTNRIKGLKIKNPADWCSDLNWWINPNGLEAILNDLKRFKKAIYITENGLADATDTMRIKFIQTHLQACASAIKNNVQLKGYFYWSLLDNFEWHQGFWPRFGLVEIDRQHKLSRIPRKSFDYFKSVTIKGNA